MALSNASITSAVPCAKREFFTRNNIDGNWATWREHVYF